VPARYGQIPNPYETRQPTDYLANPAESGSSSPLLNLPTSLLPGGMPTVRPTSLPIPPSRMSEGYDPLQGLPPEWRDLFTGTGESGGVPSGVPNAAPPAAPPTSDYFSSPDESQFAQDFSGFNGGLEEAFLSMIGNGGFSSGPSLRGPGFFAGGDAYRGNLQVIADEFNHRYGANAEATADDKIDFKDGRGPVDDITAEGDFAFMPGAGIGAGGAGSVGGRSVGGVGGAGGFGGPSSGAGGASVADALAQLGQTGSTPYGQNIASTLMDIIRGGHAPDLSRRLVSAREDEAHGMQGMVNDARGALADRGILSEPGVEQGPEIGAITRLTEQLAPSFASSISDIEQHGMDLEHEQLQNALSLATGLSSDQAKNIIGAFGAGTQLQLGLAQIALGQLQSDRQWQQFLANFGLDHDRIMEELRQGRTDQIIRLIDIFQNNTDTSAGGYIGPD